MHCTHIHTTHYTHTMQCTHIHLHKHAWTIHTRSKLSSLHTDGGKKNTPVVGMAGYRVGAGGYLAGCDQVSARCIHVECDTLVRVNLPGQPMQHIASPAAYACRHVHIDMHMDICTDMRIDMHIDMPPQPMQHIASPAATTMLHARLAVVC